MRADERENQRYLKGAQNPIGEEEHILFSLLPAEQGKRVLDVGCGIGTISLELKKMGFEVSGVDFSEVAIEKCLQQGLDARVSDVDKDGLKFADNYFDIVWASDVLEHVFDPIFLLEEICRVLKADGCVLMSVPNNFTMRKRRRIFLSGRSVQSNIYRKSRQCKHHTFFSCELLEYMLKEAKLSVYRYFSIWRIPGTKLERTTSNKVLGRLFGRIFVISARKSFSNVK